MKNRGCFRFKSLNTLRYKKRGAPSGKEKPHAQVVRAQEQQPCGLPEARSPGDPVPRAQDPGPHERHQQEQQAQQADHDRPHAPAPAREGSDARRLGQEAVDICPPSKSVCHLTGHASTGGLLRYKRGRPGGCAGAFKGFGLRKRLQTHGPLYPPGTTACRAGCDVGEDCIRTRLSRQLHTIEAPGEGTCGLSEEQMAEARHDASVSSIDAVLADSSDLAT
jgi:hypothetical protein